MKKFLSYLIDYIWFSIFLISFLFKLNFTLIPLTLALFFTPLLFIPIDAIFIKLTGTSIGKSLFLQSYKDFKSTSFKKILIGTFKQGLFNQVMKIPLINLILFKFIRKLNLTLINKKYSIKEITLNLLTLMMMGTYALFSKEMIIQKTKHYFITHEVEEKTIEPDTAWTSYADTTLKFKAHFPSSTNIKTLTVTIPNTSRILNIKSITANFEEMDYNIAHTKLPSSWLKWSGKLVLNAALKGLTSYEGGRVLSQKNCTINKKKVLEFKMQVGKKIKTGRLVLHKNMLYKVEGSYPTDMPLEKTQEESLDRFITHFSLHS